MCFVRQFCISKIIETCFVAVVSGNNLMPSVVLAGTYDVAAGFMPALNRGISTIRWVEAAQLPGASKSRPHIEPGDEIMSIVWAARSGW